MYDDMPEIENIAITIYTQERTWGWWKNYGIKGDGEFIIEDKTRGDTEADKKGNTWTLENLGNGWWKTVINLKAIKGEHNTDIRRVQILSSLMVIVSRTIPAITKVENGIKVSLKA